MREILLSPPPAPAAPSPKEKAHAIALVKPPLAEIVAEYVVDGMPRAIPAVFDYVREWREAYRSGAGGTGAAPARKARQTEGAALPV